MDAGVIALLDSGLRSFGVSGSSEGLGAIVAHLDMVAEWNERVNLTAIKDRNEVVIKHGVDSGSVLTVVDLAPGVRVLDVGTGAGFPGVTMKCLRPEIDLVLLESLAKRCRFLEAVGNEVIERRLGCSEGFEVVWGRAEDVGRYKQYRENFDVVVARAVAELRVLSELCLPFCRVGGVFIAMKGPAASNEITEASRAVAVLGGEIVGCREVQLPSQAGARTLICIRKVRQTPGAYPRKAGTPARHPL